MIVAQGREDPNQNTGISLHNCTIVASPDPMIVAVEELFEDYHHEELSRGSDTPPQCWHKWNKYGSLDTVEYMEYVNSGPGSNTS
ncbi:plant invertase/pectin methylesterase inhibitor superfamily [Actinidia rufa]|uniref:Plant invertase/pectin methylesterase inhibitor superfamily n=1 Tax=Actinidia rufa TaxID=165716 RepID=A0A7J0FK94_9ERIC|nr:plant invertase/pectin methylesterase inhibitor superfamily [Actinidia rufa]